jgi:hypothetical protein
MCPANSRLSSATESAFTGYIGIAGVGSDAATLPREDTRAGLFGYDRTVRIRDIKDGLSSTMMVMESTAELGPWAAGGPSTIRPLDPENRQYLALEGLFGMKHREDTIFRSNPVGSNVAILDGSVRWIPATVTSETLEALATIAGGDTPGDDF